MGEVGVKACCATAYGSDLVALLLGDSYHPGGLALTRRLAGLLDLAPSARVLDVAAGRGTTALLLAAEHRVRVSGLDLSAANVARATSSAAVAGLADRATFATGDAERLPYPDGSFDAVVCECAFCTFPDKPTAAAELARVLRPGGRFGITDVTADPARLPAELTSLAAWVACVGDARPLAGYAELLGAAGLRVTHHEAHDAALLRMIDQIEARLALLRMSTRTARGADAPTHGADLAYGLGAEPTATHRAQPAATHPDPSATHRAQPAATHPDPGATHRTDPATTGGANRISALGADPTALGIDLAAASPVLAAARAAVADGALGYALLVADRPS